MTDASVFDQLGMVHGGNIGHFSRDVASRDISFGLELVAFLWSGDAGNFWNYLKPSLDVFWPGVNVTAVFEDTLQDRRFASTLPNRFQPRFTRMFENDTIGFRRLQLLKFFVDEWTSADYIGFLDSDTLFVTMVTQPALFDEIRPRVIAEAGLPKATTYYIEARGVTERFLRHPEIISCMSYFPVVMRREHIRSLRDHLLRLHNASDIEALLTDLWQPSLVEFSVFCNYILVYHQPSYSFHVQHLRKKREDMRFFSRHPLPNTSQTVAAILARMDYNIIARVAIHGGYMTRKSDEPTKCDHDKSMQCRWSPLVAQKVRHGFCRSALSRWRTINEPFHSSVTRNLCSSSAFAPEKLQPDLFRFEFILSYDWMTFDPAGCERAQAQHYLCVARSIRLLDETAFLSLMSLEEDILANCTDDYNLSPPIFIAIAGAQWEVAKNWYCDEGASLAVYYVPKWESRDAMSMRRWCAEQCLQHPDCVAFAYPNLVEKSGRCWLKAVTQNSWFLKAMCGGVDARFNFYTLLEPQCRTLVHSPTRLSNGGLADICPIVATDWQGSDPHRVKDDDLVEALIGHNASSNARMVFPVIAGAQWEMTANWDCHGHYREHDLLGYPVPKWGSPESLSARKWCAEHCLKHPGCTAFSYSRYDGGPNFCWFKREAQQSWLFRTACAPWRVGVARGHDFYTLIKRTWSSREVLSPRAQNVELLAACESCCVRASPAP